MDVALMPIKYWLLNAYGAVVNCFLGVNTVPLTTTSKYSPSLFLKIPPSRAFTVEVAPSVMLNIPLDGVTLTVVVLPKVPEAVYSSVPPDGALKMRNPISTVVVTARLLFNNLP